MSVIFRSQSRASVEARATEIRTRAEIRAGELLRHLAGMVVISTPVARRLEDIVGVPPGGVPPGRPPHLSPAAKRGFS
jgi:hypothetical protein